MGIVEFGKANDHRSHKRAIVPQDERAQAEQDARDYGFGYLYDERRLDPSQIEVVLPNDSPTMLGQVMQEWIQLKDKERHGEHRG
jgi:hypothetical protein